MKEQWYILLAAILCAIFSKQIDYLVARTIKDSKKRAVLYCVSGAITLALIGLLIYQAWNGITRNEYIIILSILPLLLFGIGIIFVKYYGKKRRSNSTGELIRNDLSQDQEQENVANEKNT